MSSNVPYYSASDPTVDNGKLYGASDPPAYGEPTYGAPSYDDGTLHSKGPAQTKDGGADPKGGDVVEASVSAYPVSVAVERPSQLAVATADGDVIEYRIPQAGPEYWMGLAFLSTAWFAVVCVCIYYVTVEYIHFDKPMKGFCSTTDEMDENLCFFAVGQYAYGIISMGQFGFGFFNFSQIGIGLITGFGQIQGGLGVTVAQITCSSFVPACQVGLAITRVLYAQFGFQVLGTFRHVNGKHDSAVVTCKCGKRRRRN